MDPDVLAVFDIYRQRMRDEGERRRSMTAAERDAHNDRRLLAVGPDTGQLLHVIARSLVRPTILEIGTSFGYSTLWLADAARAAGGRVVTMESQAHKSAYARDMIARAGLADWVDFRVGDAVAMIDTLSHTVDLVLLDLWKHLYCRCLDVFFPRLAPGAIVVADNMIRGGGEDTAAYARAIRARPGITSVLLPVGTGIEVSRYDPA